MKQIRIRLLLLLGAVLLLIGQASIPVHAEEETAGAFLLLEANTGSILAENHAEEVRPVSSLAKLMTAYLTAHAMQEGTLTAETLLTAGESVREVSGAVIWLEPGDKATVQELLAGLLIGNANDAASVLAERISGSTERFVMDMNAAAFDLGMRSTRFTSPQGYDDPAAYSTAKDMGKLACAVLNCPELTECLTTWRTIIREEQTPAELVNENTLTRTMDNCQGLKAAHSPDAGQCLIAAAEREDMLCVTVILGCAESEERFTLAKSLLKQGFSGFSVTVPGFAEEFLPPLKVRGGTESAVLLEVSGLSALAVPGGEPLTTVLVLPQFLQAPVPEGRKAGSVYFYQGETLLCEASLLTAEEVPEMTFPSAWRKVLRKLLSS